MSRKYVRDIAPIAMSTSWKEGQGKHAFPKIVFHVLLIYKISKKSLCPYPFLYHAYHAIEWIVDFVNEEAPSIQFWNA